MNNDTGNKMWCSADILINLIKRSGDRQEFDSNDLVGKISMINYMLLLSRARELDRLPVPMTISLDDFYVDQFLICQLER